MQTTRIDLPISEMPRQWYNIQADLPRPLDPPLNPATGQPLGPEDLAAIFPMSLIEQEMSQDRWVDIPEELLEVYARWRPSPLFRAYKLEEALGTPAKIYYKNEMFSPAGSHKPNTAVAQAYYNKQEGVRRITTETGAGQWGSALAMACAIFDLECRVYMVRISYDQKPYRRVLMQSWGAECFPSPSDQTEFGRKILAETPDSPGSLGIAISEAIEDAVKHDDTKYSLGSVLNHVLMHQTIIGLEAKKQFEMVGDYPDVLIGCHGGGSNFSGFVFPFVADKIAGSKDPEVIAVEPTASPTLTRGPYAYDSGDAAQMTPLLRMYTLGHGFVPAPVHAGGLRYHGAAPLVSLLKKEGLIEAVAYHQKECFESAVLFARTELWLPAPETAHAVHCAIQKALQAKEEGREMVIAFNFSGHGFFDLAGYEKYFAGELQDYEMPAHEIERALEELPKVE
ncbi:MAG: TrpB-like pyridoxal phosphate-dependent enzyme [Armatimonadetes bacterium]|nr:TrpB-like pyridoxal phosphate-dependent enzyme [Armatimonadota bacterium]